ncbi:SAM-dependent methyltransferase [Actinomadura sp. KC216]|uniref:methyltransferase n=1 Tax=Actinomadura sp. KC216 TaxID=2530370 RepID=UPI001053D9B8|nr:methyltransferase [Actinomadura sp. KC216]TDB83237.1 SAM-dependent methyltransferase [Actinomadura sp. KC216]
MESGTGTAVTGEPCITGEPPIIGDDRRRIRHVYDYLVSRSDADAVSDVLPPGAPPEMVEAVTANCTVDHAGCLVFPSATDAVRTYLEEQGLRPAKPFASSIVRDRLAARYDVRDDRLKAGCLDVKIIHGQLPGNSSRGIEVLSVAPGDELDASALRDERSAQHENHVAVRLTDPARLEELRRALTRPGGPRPDGGGYNPAQGEDGITVLHFRSEGSTPMGWPRRLEIIAPGRHTEALLRHLRPPEPEPGHKPEQERDGDRRLLRRLTGAWGVQAIRVMVDLGIPDHLAERPLTCKELAVRTGVDADRLNRLLRALCHPWIGALTPTGDAFALTGLGRRLTSAAPDSMRHIAQLYGGLFYQTFGELAGAITDGAQPFVTVFGQKPFEYFGDHPRERRLFARAMAEGAFFPDVAAAVDLSGARTVADIGGGNGELLAHLCDAYPGLEGALLERPEVIEAARDNLGARGHLDRCTLHPGSFTDGRDVPAGADVYVVARILHDWDDQTCLSILRAVRDAAARDSTLLIIERPLPDDPGDASVSTLWDLNMLVNNVGGRERTRDQYRRLLAEAGFQVVGEKPLRLDVSVTIATPAR